MRELPSSVVEAGGLPFKASTEERNQIDCHQKEGLHVHVGACFKKSVLCQGTTLVVPNTPHKWRASAPAGLRNQNPTTGPFLKHALRSKYDLPA
jgi:hypothetical protein